MKEKKVLILLLIVILVLFLGIGYATLTAETLHINGSASAIAADDNFTVRFKKTQETFDQPTNLSNATATVTDAKTATITVTGLTKVGDKATATYEVENASNGIDANVVANATVTNTEYFKVTTTGITSEATKIASGDHQAITVTVELIKTPVADQSGTVTVTLTADAVE